MGHSSCAVSNCHKVPMNFVRNNMKTVNSRWRALALSARNGLAASGPARLKNNGGGP